MWQRRWIWDRITGFLLTADRKIWNVCLLFPQIYGKKTVSSVEQADFGRVFRMLWKHIIRNVFFIATSCVAGVIGDDAESESADAEMRYGIPVICIPYAGFLGGEYSEGVL